MNPPSTNGAGRKIRVLLVDDSAISIEIIRRMLAPAQDIEVVGAATNGIDALELMPQIHPDVICTDLHMPKMNGLEMIREVMTRYPLPILVLSVSVRPDQEDNIFRMLEAGALDILAKPCGGLESDFGVTAHNLITKIRVLAGVTVIKKRRAEVGAVAKLTQPISGLATSSPRIIGIGASTGGPQALARVLGDLPADFPLPLLCVQHIAETFMQGLVSWLAGCCRIRICTAKEGERPLGRTAYFPPDGRHLEIDDAGVFRCSDSLPIGGHRPSVDIAFSSLAHHYGAAAVGVLLTGMGQDGAQGLLDIVHAGGVTIVQDESSSVVFGMPKRAIELGAAQHVLSIDQIGPALRDFATYTGNRASTGNLQTYRVDPESAARQERQ